MQNKKDVVEQLEAMKKRHRVACEEGNNIDRIKAATAIYNLAWMLGDDAAKEHLPFIQLEQVIENRFREKCGLPLLAYRV